MAFKAALGRRMSIIAFGFAQVAIDIEPLLAFIFAWPVLHGWTHTYAGATLIAVAVTALGRRPAEWILRRWNQELRYHKLYRFQSPESLSLGQVACGAFIGSWSHVAFDSLMHPDMQPLAPFSASNGLLDLATYHQVNGAFAILIVIGIVAWALWPKARA